MKRRLLILFLVVQLAEGHFDATECDKTKKCIFSPAGCQQEKSKCQHMLSYSADEDGWVDLMISSTNNEPNDNYIALGFSEDDEMGNEPVTQCVFPKDGKPTAHFSFNVGKSNNPVTDPSDVEAEKKNLKLLHAHKGDDGMYCHLRQRSNTVSEEELINDFFLETSL
nr:DOMON domain containing protein [Haemonchus contortus]